MFYLGGYGLSIYLPQVHVLHSLHPPHLHFSLPHEHFSSIIFCLL
jgi:hypothetical protein